MKYCPKCGAELLDEAEMCPSCGESLAKKSSSNNGTLYTVAKVFMIITIAASLIGALMSVITLAGLGSLATSAEELAALKITQIAALIGYLIPLAWCIPMTISLSKKVKNREPISTAFKVCTLLFVNIISGICLLCAKND